MLGTAGIDLAVPKSRHRRRRLSGDHLSTYLYAVPGVALGIVAVGVPVVEVLLMAFRQINDFGDSEGWAGLSDFRLMWESGLPSVLLTTAEWTLGVLIPTILLSLLLGLALSRNLRGQLFFRLMLLVPWAVPVAVTAILFQLILNPSSGQLNLLLAHLHLISAPVGWLGAAKTAMPAMIAIAVWVSIPFTALTLLSAIQAIPSELREAAVLDGANSFQELRQVILPQIRNAMQLVVLINITSIFNNFGLIWILTQGGPANSTSTVTVWVYKLAFSDSEFGPAGAAAAISFVGLLLLAFAYLATYRRGKETDLL